MEFIYSLRGFQKSIEWICQLPFFALVCYCQSNQYSILIQYSILTFLSRDLHYRHLRIHNFTNVAVDYTDDITDY